MALWRKSDTSKTAELKAVTKVDQTGEFTPPKPSKKKKTSPGKETSTKTPDSPPGFFSLLRQAMGLAFRVLFWAVFLVTLAVTGTLSVAWKHWQGSLTQVDAFCTLRRSTLEVTCSFRNRGLSSARRCVSFVAQRSKNKVKRRVCSRWLRPWQRQSRTQLLAIPGGCSRGCKLLQKTGVTISQKRGFKGMLLFARDGYLRQFAALERWLGGKKRKKRR
jgi:hypothetical protein